MLEGKYDPTIVEPKAQALWDEVGVYRFDPDAPGEIFSIDTPPPTVSGSLHVGHVFSYTQAECIARYMRMKGRNVFYPFGFDGNGLPTERLTEKERGVLGIDMPREDFVKLCRETCSKYEHEFEEMWRSLGFSADWSLAYSTIDERAIRISQRGFLDMHAKGEVYLHHSPSLWDTEAQTTLAQAELEEKTQRTFMNDVRFDLADGGEVVIATTRPELLSACVAMFIHPDHPKAATLLGKKAIVPLYGHEVTILADEKADPEKGTGIVMCCTFGDKTDVEWYQKHDLELRQAIGKDGKLTEIAGSEAGMYVKPARRSILERLEQSGHLLGREEVENVVKIGERTKREIEFLPMRQWFVRVLEHKSELIELGNKVRWFPAHMGKRYANWVEGLEWDWCISRQRFYGVPFPVWYCEGCEAVFVAPDEWLPILDHGKHDVSHACASCGGTAWRPEMDVMDTWATSSETPEINARWGDPEDGERRCPMPMTLRPQAHDIIRTWAFYTIVKSRIHFDDIPWQDAMVSGHVQAPGRQKIGKSLGNAPADPRDMITQHGADPTRYWALSATLGNDYVYNDDDFKQGRRLCVKLWNASKFAQQRLEDFDPKAETAPPEPIDTWIRARLAKTVALVSANLDRYEFGIAKGDVERFFWGDLCDNYLEMIKNRLYDDSPEGAASRRAAQAGLYDVLCGVLRLLTPYVPHVCEIVHQSLFRASEGVPAIAAAPWPAAEAPSSAEDAEADGQAAVAVLTAIRRWRSEQKLSPGKPLARAHLNVASEGFARFDGVREAVRAAGRVETLDIDHDDALPAGEVRLLTAEAVPPKS